MAASGSQTLPTIGFFTVTEDAEMGYVGGLLVLNAAGRPLEFHCTAPLKPNRAQEILYGPTLRPFLYGEQIGATLAAKARSDTLFLCTDAEPAMCLRDTIKTPLVLIQTAGTGNEPDPPMNSAAGQPPSPLLGSPVSSIPTYCQLTAFRLGKHTAAVLSQHESDRSLVEERWQPFADSLDLSEPFSRIRGALEEAQRGANK